MNVNEMIIELRKFHSRKKLAELTGLTTTKIYNLEKGRTPRPEEVTSVELAWDTHNTRELLPEDVITGDESVSPPVPPEIVAPENIQLTSLDPDEEDLEFIQWIDDVDTRYSMISLSEREQPVVEVVTGSLSPTLMSVMDGYRRYANSEVQTFKQCRRRWWLTFYRGLRPRYEEPVGVKFIGQRIHRALERWYVPDGVTRTDPRDALELLIVNDWTALVTHYSHHSPGDEGVPPDVEKKFTSDADLERVMLDGYVTWVAETGADREYHVVGTEEYREMFLTEVPDTVVIAKLDARVTRESDGRRLNLEHKTTGDLHQLTQTLHLDEQNQWQIMVERDQPGDDSHVVGTLFNMLKRVKRTVRATPPFYRRVEVHRNQLETDNFRERVVGTIRTVEQVRLTLDSTPHAHRGVAYPTPTNDCRWRCPFFDVCGAIDDGSRYEAMLDERYETGDPYHYYVNG